MATLNSLPKLEIESSPTSPTPWEVQAIAARLKRAGAALRQCSWQQRVQHLSDWLDCWRAPSSPWRAQAVQVLAQERGHHPHAVARALERLFEPYHPDALLAWMERELVTTEAAGYPRSVWTAPELVGVILAGNVPPPALQSLLSCLLVGTPVFLKLSSEAPAFPQLLRASLKHQDLLLYDAVATETWSGPAIQTDALLRHVDVVQVYGGEATVQAIRMRTPARTRVIEHGPRVSLTYLTREALACAPQSQLADRVVEDLILYEQQGCLSPHWILVEESEAHPATELCERLQQALTRSVERCPPAPLEEGQAAAQVQLKGVHAFLGTLYETSGGSVCLEREGDLNLSCLGRLGLVRPVRDEHEAAQLLRPWRGLLQGLALECPPERRMHLLERFLPLGFSYLCRPGALQQPPASWPGDGRRSLAELVSWAVLDDEL